MTAALAGLCAACSVLTFPGRTAKRRLETLLPTTPRSPRWRRLSTSASWQSVGPALAVGVFGALLCHSPVLALLLPVASWQGHRAWLRRRARIVANQRRGETVALCLAFRAELRGGQDGRAALREATESSSPELAALLVGPLTAGDDVIPILRTAAKEPGREALSYLAACWHASEGGAGMARAIGRLAVALRAAETQRREVAAELAAVRASARLLAVLPTAGIALGSGMGAGPLDVLMHTVAGQVCLVLGVGCVLIGLAWMNQIVRSAEARS
jgi:tight adherence protein B